MIRFPFCTQERSPNEKTGSRAIRTYRPRASGFSLVEMLIAMTLLAIIVSVFLILGVQMTSMTSQARLRDQAVTIAQSEIESRRANPNTLSTTLYTTSVPVLYGNRTINLTKTVSISSSTPSNNLFRVLVTVTSSQVAAVSMETYILKE